MFLFILFNGGKKQGCQTHLYSCFIHEETAVHSFERKQLQTLPVCYMISVAAEPTPLQPAEMESEMLQSKGAGAKYSHVRSGATQITSNTRENGIFKGMCERSGRALILRGVFLCFFGAR